MSADLIEPASLCDVAAAVSTASEVERLFYIEYLGDGWRWSLAHRGGAYALMRITARFLGVDYRAMLIGFRTVDGVAVMAARSVVEVQAASFIELDGPCSADYIEERIAAVFARRGL